MGLVICHIIDIISHSPQDGGDEQKTYRYEIHTAQIRVYGDQTALFWRQYDR